ncbi:hypothetical protein ACT4S5_18025 [Kocuria oceani]|uniref:hypothetical protein n=1 Tax=Kocuria oceani TaxID=988827 RepID=UPI0040357D72
MGEFIVKWVHGQTSNLYPMLCSALFLLVCWAEIFRGENVFELAAYLIGLLGLEAQSNYVLSNLIPFLKEFRTFAFWGSVMALNISFSVAFKNHIHRPELMKDLSPHGATFIGSIAVAITSAPYPYWVLLIAWALLYLAWNVGHYSNVKKDFGDRVSRWAYYKKINKRHVADVLLSIVAVVLIPITIFAPEYDYINAQTEQ